MSSGGHGDTRFISTKKHTDIDSKPSPMTHGQMSSLFSSPLCTTAKRGDKIEDDRDSGKESILQMAPMSLSKMRIPVASKRFNHLNQVIDQTKHANCNKQLYHSQLSQILSQSIAEVGSQTTLTLNRPMAQCRQGKVITDKVMAEIDPEHERLRKRITMGPDELFG